MYAIKDDLIKRFGEREVVALAGNEDEVIDDTVVETALADAEELVTHAIHPYTRSLLSAIPMPSPRRERQKKLLVYDPSMHDYSTEAPQWRELRPRHWVLCSASEAEDWCRES